MEHKIWDTMSENVHVSDEIRYIHPLQLCPSRALWSWQNFPLNDERELEESLTQNNELFQSKAEFLKVKQQ